MAVDRLRSFVRRHGPTLGILAGVGLGVHVIAAVRFDETVALDVDGMPYPLLHVVAVLSRLLTSFGVDAGTEVIVALLAFAAGVAAFLGTWRLTGNRIVSLGCGLLYCLHPTMVSSARHSRGVADVLVALFVAVAFVLVARGRRRSSRYPNRPATLISLELIALVFLATLTVPAAWTVALFVLLFDSTFSRGTRAFDVDVKGHGVLLAVSALQLLWIGSAGETTPISSDVVPASWTGRLVFAVGLRGDLWTGPIVAAAALVVGVAFAAMDIVKGTGRRRTIVRSVGFATAWIVVAMLSLAIVSSHTGAPAAATLGLCLAIPTLFWRLGTALIPPQDATPVYCDAPAPWDVVRGRVELVPMPVAEVMGDPAATISRSSSSSFAPHLLDPTLRAALERLGRDAVERPAHVATRARRRLSDAAFDRLVRPHLDPGHHVLGVAVGRNPHATQLAMSAARFTLWRLDPEDGGGGGLGELGEMAGITVVESGAVVTELETGVVDLAVVVGVFRSTPTSRIGAVLVEIRRLLREPGIVVMTFASLEHAVSTEARTAMVHGISGDDARYLVERAGLEVTHLEALEGTDEFVVVARPRSESGRENS